MKKNIKEANLQMDFDTYNKVKTKLKPTDNVSIVDKKNKTQNQQSSTNSTSLNQTSSMLENDVIEGRDQETIKYVSNVIDEETSEISKPFTIGGKKYQMVRGKLPNKKIVNGVYCLDDKDDKGVNKIYSVEYFEENIAKKFLKENEPIPDTNKLENNKPNTRNEGFIDHLNLKDLLGFKHFFVNIKTGDIKAKFKTIKEMIKSGIKLGSDEDYMNMKELTRFRFNHYFNNEIDEEIENNGDGRDASKLQSDVKKLANSIKNKFSVYLSKIDKPIEQSQFLVAMAKEIGVPLQKLSSVINNYKDLAKETTTQEVTTESINKRKVIKTIKIKDLK